MMAMNALKVLGVAALLAGLNPLLAFAVVGVGAAAYAPAKYGLVDRTGAAAPAGGGQWLDRGVHGLRHPAGCGAGRCAGQPAGRCGGRGGLPGLGPLDAAATLLLGVYALAALLNLGIPASGVRMRRAHRSSRSLVRSFVRAQRRLWADAQGCLSMSVTTLFWGAAAVLQFAVLKWAVDHLGLSLGQAAGLQAVVAVGIVAGAALASRLRGPGRRRARAAAGRADGPAGAAGGPGDALAGRRAAAAGGGRAGRRAGGAAERAAAAPRPHAAERGPLHRRAELQRKPQRAGDAGASTPRCCGCRWMCAG